MHLPRILARFNRHVTNPIQRRWAGVIPLHGIIEHTGRTSGRTYRTPVLVFGHATGFVITIGYGLSSDWVRNLLAAGGGGLTHRRRRYTLTRPRVLTGSDALAALPAGYRRFAKLVGVEGVLVVDAAAG
jgi:deazaflavin-dependent oxidoreductase (nitroreductase family)